jgi:hypothetical protein
MDHKRTKSLQIPQRPHSAMMDSSAGASARLPMFALSNSPQTLRHSRGYKTVDESSCREEDYLDFLLTFDGDQQAPTPNKALKKSFSATQLVSQGHHIPPSVPLPSGQDLLCPFPRKGVSVNMPTKNCLVIHEEEEVLDIVDQLAHTRLAEVDLSSSMKARNEFFEIVRPSVFCPMAKKSSLPRHKSAQGSKKTHSPSCTKSGFGLAF